MQNQPSQIAQPCKETPARKQPRGVPYDPSNPSHIAAMESLGRNFARVAVMLEERRREEEDRKKAA